MELVKRVIDFVMDILETVVFIGSLFIVLYLFVMAPHQVRGSSMDDTFHNGEYILTSKISYKFGAPKRGDVIVFKSPKNPDIDFIKRILGLSGDTILIKDGQVFVNGELMNENYIKDTTNIPGGFIQNGVEVTVPDGELFVMGDNRPNSEDSRRFGFIPREDVIGKVFFRYFPLTRMGPIKNPIGASDQSANSSKNLVVVSRLPESVSLTFAVILV